MRGGEPVRVSEKSGTHYLKPCDRLAARIVQVGARTEMAGGVLPFSHEAGEAVLNLLRRGGERARKEIDSALRARKLDMQAGARLTDTELLRSSAFVFTNFWLDALLGRTLNPAVPQLCNTDGDDIAFTTVRFPLAPHTTAAAVRRALGSIPSLRQAERFFWNWIGSSEAASRVQKPDRQCISTMLDDGSPVLGTIELKGKALILEANSPQRAGRGRALIAATLGGMVGNPLVETTTMEEMMAAAPTERTKPLSRVPPDVAREIIHAILHRHYTDLLDQHVPMLGDVTPRQAAKSAAGREKLVEWLKLLENGMAAHDGNSPMAGYDVRWLWRELDIP